MAAGAAGLAAGAAGLAAGAAACAGAGFAEPVRQPPESRGVDDATQLLGALVVRSREIPLAQISRPSANRAAPAAASSGTSCPRQRIEGCNLFQLVSGEGLGEDRRDFFSRSARRGASAMLPHPPSCRSGPDSFGEARMYSLLGAPRGLADSIKTLGRAQRRDHILGSLQVFRRNVLRGSGRLNVAPARRKQGRQHGREPLVYHGFVALSLFRLQRPRSRRSAMIAKRREC